MSPSSTVSEIFNVEQWCALEIWVTGHSRLLKMVSSIDCIQVCIGIPRYNNNNNNNKKKSGRVHLADGSNVVVLELPYSTEFGRERRKLASGVRKYGKFDDGR